MTVGRSETPCSFRSDRGTAVRGHRRRRPRRLFERRAHHPSLAAEALEPRTLMAVTALLNGGDLEISFTASTDTTAEIFSDGKDYTVSGSGVTASRKFPIADVAGRILVRDTSTSTSQFFHVLPGAAILHPLQVEKTVEATSIDAAITASRSGEIRIGSKAISLANDVSTALTNANVVFEGDLALGADVVISAGLGGAFFHGTVDSHDRILRSLTVNAAGDTAFGDGGADTVGRAFGLRSLTTGGGGTTRFNILPNDTVVPSVRTELNQSYGDDVLLQSSIVLDSSAGNGHIEFDKQVDGGGVLDLNAGTGAVSFRAAVGGSFPLAGLVLRGAGSVTAAAGATLRLDGSAALTTDGLTIFAGVNQVSLTQPGSAIRNFSGDGVHFVGGSTNSTLDGFEISGNGANGMRFGPGSYVGTSVTRNQIFRNANDGIALDARGESISNLLIGGVKAKSDSAGNQIFSNGANGIQVHAGDYFGTNIRGNSIGSPGRTFVTAAEGTKVMVSGDMTDRYSFGQVVVLKPSSPLAKTVRRTIVEMAFDGKDTALVLSEPLASAITTGELAVGNLGHGILLNAKESSITFLLVGAGSAGEAIAGNTIYANTGDGVCLGAGDYTGTVVGDHNEIVANANGIQIEAGGARNLYVSGNTIGTRAGGAEDRGNAGDGVLVQAGDYTGTLIVRNTIAYNAGDGVRLAAAPTMTNLSVTDNTIQGNDSDGIHADAGDYAGSFIRRNTIAENAENGILLQAEGGALTDLIIGGMVAIEHGNVIRDNGRGGASGIAVSTGDFSGTKIAGNTIRDNGDSGTHVGSGILVRGTHLTIGADIASVSVISASSPGNTITRNALHGIDVSGPGAVDNTILSNSIFLNGPGVKVNGGMLGAGIATTNGGHSAAVAPEITRIVRDSADGVVRVELIVRSTGKFIVQLFANTAADELGLPPSLPSAFEGRSLLYDGLSFDGSAGRQSPSSIVASVVEGNELTTIEIPDERVAVGDWITATATRQGERSPVAETSPFSSALQARGAPMLAVASAGRTGPWDREYAFTAGGALTARIDGLSPFLLAAFVAIDPVTRKTGLADIGVVIVPEGGGSTITGRILRSTSQGTALLLSLALDDNARLVTGTRGTLLLGGTSLPTARLYNVSTPDAPVVFEVGPQEIAAALGRVAGISVVQRNAFVTRFQGGLRVASGDFDADGITDLVTAPGGVPAGVANPLTPGVPLASLFGATTRVITIYNGGSPASRGWQSASVDVSAVFPGYSGGFLVAAGNISAEAWGSGSGVTELIVASTDRMEGTAIRNKVAIFDVRVPGRGMQPQFRLAGTPLSVAGTITGLTTGDFSNDATTLADVVVATTTATQLGAKTPAAAGTSFVHVFRAATGFATASSFAIDTRVYNTSPARGGFLVNAFLNGASLAAGDVDGDRKVDLVLGAAAMGLGNFRVLSNALVASGNQAAITAALRPQNLRSTNPLTGQWQPGGGPDFFSGTAVVPTPNGYGMNAPLGVAVVDIDGRSSRSKVFAAFAGSNAGLNSVRGFYREDVESGSSPRWNQVVSVRVLPGLASRASTARVRLPLGDGIRIG